jgi:hypothetical protein
MVCSRRREAVVGFTIWRVEPRRRLYYSEPPFRLELAPLPNDRLMAVSVSTLAAAHRRQPLRSSHTKRLGSLCGKATHLLAQGHFYLVT